MKKKKQLPLTASEPASLPTSLRSIGILVVARFAQLGGGEIRLLNEVEALRSRGHRVIVMLLSERGPLSVELEKLGIPVEHQKLEYAPGLSGTAKLFAQITSVMLRLFMRYRFKTVLAFQAEALIAVGPAARLLRRSLLFRSSGDVFVNNDIKQATWLGARFPRFLHLLNPKLLPISHWQAPMWQQLGFRNIAVCVAGVRIEPSKISRIPAPRPRITFIGRMSRIKGPDIFIRAIGLLRERSLDFDTLMVGDDSFDNQYSSEGGIALQLNELMDQLGLKGHIDMLGFQAEIEGILAKTDIFVSASRFEMTGNATMEAAMAGIATVATRTRGSEEIVLHERTGFLVPIDDVAAMADALEKLIVSPELRQTMGEETRRLAYERYHNPICLGRLCQVIEEFVG